MDDIEINNNTENISLLNLIRNKQYFKSISSIKNYEDTISKVFNSTTNNIELIQDPFIYLWKIGEDEKDLFNNMSECDLTIFTELQDLFNNEEIMNNIVITGPYIRSQLFKYSKKEQNNDIEIRKEIYIYKLCNEEWNELIDTTNFIDKKNELIYENNDTDIKIFLIKKKYKSPAHVILQYNYLKRVGLYNNEYYTSSMFLIEIQNHNNLLISEFRDPILGIPYDPLDIYQLHKKEKSHPIKIIELTDYEELIKLNKKNFIKLFNSKTCLEICLDRYIKEDHPIILNQLKQMIIFLSSFIYKRPPHLYGKLLKLDTLIPEIYDIIKCVPNKYNITDDLDINIFNNIEEINDKVIEFIITMDNVENLLDYIEYIKQKIGKNIVEYVIKHNASHISKYLMSNGLDTYLTYYIILMTENLELIKELNADFDMNLALNFFEDILSNGKIRSFYFLYEIDNSIISTIFKSERNILHKIKPNGFKYKDMIQLIIKLKPELLNITDCNKESPVLYHAKYNPSLLKIFLEHNIDPTITDNDGNIFLHNLCQHDEPELLKYVLKKYPELINMPNNKAETPAIICTKTGNENMFYIIKGMGADLGVKDYYGNTVYHYICATSICIGMMIYNDPNYFNIIPQDYCKISPKYYNFITK